MYYSLVLNQDINRRFVHGWSLRHNFHHQLELFVYLLMRSNKIMASWRNGGAATVKLLHPDTAVCVCVTVVPGADPRVTSLL